MLKNIFLGLLQYQSLRLWIKLFSIIIIFIMFSIIMYFLFVALSNHFISLESYTQHKLPLFKSELKNSNLTWYAIGQYWLWFMYSNLTTTFVWMFYNNQRTNRSVQQQQNMCSIIGFLCTVSFMNTLWHVHIYIRLLNWRMFCIISFIHFSNIKIIKKNTFFAALLIFSWRLQSNDLISKEVLRVIWF